MIDLISSEERNQLIFEFNDTKVDYPKNKTIIDLFEEQVKKTPDNIAIVFKDVKLTYNELNEKTNQLGSYLRENYLVAPDNLIGIKLERNEDLIIAILGVIKSGAAYVPIDISYPQERINYIEKDSNCKVVIDELELKQFKAVQDKYGKENIAKINSLSDLAYVIYTSGTTGNPKGVMVAHSNIAGFCFNILNKFSDVEND
jgi:non-ribosomal peptide synthetase component F